jgi:hypothetical protein
MQDRELAKRRARKPTDKTIPDGVDEIVPNVELYKRLRDMERRYDATILRKRLDVQDAVNRNVKVCLPSPQHLQWEEGVGGLLTGSVEPQNPSHLHLKHSEGPTVAKLRPTAR